MAKARPVDVLEALELLFGPLAVGAMVAEIGSGSGQLASGVGRQLGVEVAEFGEACAVGGAEAVEAEGERVASPGRGDDRLGPIAGELVVELGDATYAPGVLVVPHQPGRLSLSQMVGPLLPASQLGSSVDGGLVAGEYRNFGLGGSLAAVAGKAC